jgi:hypothetical protein
MGGITSTLMHGVTDAAWGIGGKVTARVGVSKFGFVPGSMTGLLVEAGIGVVGAMLLRKISPAGTRAFLQGAFMAPLETLAITNKVPFVSDYLGDYGTLNVRGGYNQGALAPGFDAGAFAGYPQPTMLNGYPSGGFRDDSMGDFDSTAGQFR